MSKTSVLNYKEFLPAPQLREFIECLWVLEGTSKGTRIIRETLVPGGRVEIMFTSSRFLWYPTNKTEKAEFYTGSFLLGQRNSVSYVDFKGDILLFGIRFRYGCAPLFVECAAESYSNKIVPLSELTFHETLQMISGDNHGLESFIEQVEKWLSNSLKSAPDDWYKLRNLIQHMSGQHIENIVLNKLYEKFGWNYKKAERVFLKYLGFSPRTFLKLLRFRNALEKMKTKPESFTDAAHRLGFYDQSHFIREFHTYAGSNPSSFFKDLPEVAALLYKLSR